MQRLSVLLRTPALRRPAVLALGALALGAYAAVPARVDDEVRSGWFHIVWQTRGLDNQLADVNYLLVDERGRSTRLVVDARDAEPFGGVLKLNGRRVTATGELLTAAGDARAPLLRVDALRADQGPRFAVSGAPQLGSRAYVTILCRFSDRALADPRPKETYQQWMGNSYPGLDHFWREQSEDRVDLTGTVVVGPYVLPKPAADYVTGTQANLQALVLDCTGAADADVDFSAYAGINMQFNSDLGGFSWGGGWTFTRDGVTRRWATTWMADWASQSTYAHETGHSLGLPHSSGPYGNVYDSGWDVMSGGGATDPFVGTRVAPHTIAWHKDLLGWVPTARKYVAGPNTSATFTLERSAIPPAGGYQLAEIPIPGGNTFYTVEARRYSGYDALRRLPGEAVVIHKVDVRDASPAKVVDSDGNGNPNDAGARWLPGESFSDPLAGVRVTVLEETATGFRVEVSTVGGVTVQGDSVRPTATMGAPYADQLTAAGGEGAASWAVSAGRLPDGLTLAGDGSITGVPAEAGAFTFTVSVSSGGAFGARSLVLVVVKPDLAAATVMSQYLGGGSTLTPDQARFLDLLGNRNGRLDVGDVRAWLVDRQLIPR
ncbi:MAG TPA: putative Ig domain-containing protein [Longimicrobiaceae bacterium]|nr:putative Ig domain-containing protein [Longimicrobiaceae bacterium]